MIHKDAVEAAAEAVARTISGDTGTYPNDEDREIARAALEAGAPHMLADLLALCDKADKDPGSMYCKLTTYEIRQALGANNE